MDSGNGSGGPDDAGPTHGGSDAGVADDAGASSDSGSTTCGATFSGPISGTAACSAPFIIVDLTDSNQGWQLIPMPGGVPTEIGDKAGYWQSVGYGALPGSPPPATGGYSCTAQGGGSSIVTDYTVTSHYWNAQCPTSGQAGTGTITFTITSLGPRSANVDNNRPGYASPHGTITATMTDNNNAAAPNVTMKATF